MYANKNWDLAIWIYVCIKQYMYLTVKYFHTQIGLDLGIGEFNLSWYTSYTGRSYTPKAFSHVKAQSLSVCKT